jgi:hypothetical protein
LTTFIKIRKTTRTLYRVLVVFIPLVLLLLPATIFDSGPTICISKLITDIDCPGCGITRAVQHALHLDFQTAWAYNKLIIVIAPLLIWLYFQEVKTSYTYFFQADTPSGRITEN